MFSILREAAKQRRKVVYPTSLPYMTFIFLLHCQSLAKMRDKGTIIPSKYFCANHFLSLQIRLVVVVAILDVFCPQITMHLEIKAMVTLTDQVE